MQVYKKYRQLRPYCWRFKVRVYNTNTCEICNDPVLEPGNKNYFFFAYPAVTDVCAVSQGLTQLSGKAGMREAVIKGRCSPFCVCRQHLREMDQNRILGYNY